MAVNIFGSDEWYDQSMKGKTDKAVEKIDAILAGYFSSLPPAECARKEGAFIQAAK